MKRWAAEFSWRLSLRKNFADNRSWLWMLYGRMLRSPLGRVLPGMRSVRGLRLRDMPDPLLIRLGTTDQMVLDEIFFRGEYDALLGLQLTDVRNIVDLGANVGLSLRLWRWKFPEATIVAVEPDPENLDMCRANITAAHAAPAVRFVQACAAGAPGSVHLDRSQGEWGYRMVAEPTSDSIDVPAMTLRNVLDAAGVIGDLDLLKCDIEGGERELFADCRDWIGHVRVIMAELHGDYTTERYAADVARNGGNFRHQEFVKGGERVVLSRRVDPQE